MQHKSSVKTRKFVQLLSWKGWVLFLMPWHNSWKCKMFAFISDIQTLCFAGFGAFCWLQHAPLTVGEWSVIAGLTAGTMLGALARLPALCNTCTVAAQQIAQIAQGIIYKYTIFFYRKKFWAPDCHIGLSPFTDEIEKHALSTAAFCSSLWWLLFIITSQSSHMGHHFCKVWE